MSRTERHGISKRNAPSFAWRDVCEGWTLADSPSLHVIQERMPPQTFELRHRHEKTWQFYFVLTGEATIEHDGLLETLGPGEGLEIPARIPHQMRNDSATNDLEFLVASSQRPREDRIDVQPL